AHLLVPRQDLGSLMPAKAIDWLKAHGASTQTGTRATALRAGHDGWDITLRADGLERTGHADQVILATSAEVAGQLVSDAAADMPSGPGSSMRVWADEALGLPQTAIATVYARAPGARLSAPMLALRPAPAGPGFSAQFVF